MLIFRPDEVRGEHFEPGEVVFDQGDCGNKVYFIAKGAAKVLKDGEVVAEIAGGDVFGEIALVSDRPRTAAVRARTALDVVSVNREAFGQLLAHVPGRQADHAGDHGQAPRRACAAPRAAARDGERRVISHHLPAQIPIIRREGELMGMSAGETGRRLNYSRIGL